MAYEIKATIEGLDKIRAVMQRAPQIAEPIFQKAVSGSQDILAKYTTGRNSGGPVPWRTGNLTLSFRKQVGRMWARWYPTAPYAIYVQKGVEPFIMRPKNKKALYWPGAAHPVRSVKNPGFKGNPFMNKILDLAQPEINTLFANSLDRVTEALAER